MKNRDCLCCFQIFRYKDQGLSYEELTINGYRATRLIESNALVMDPTLVEAHSKLTSYELTSGRWCKDCGKRIN